MILNDIDIWREALQKCNLRESVMPMSRGFLIEQVETYNKIQAMLNCPEMDKAYSYLYELDVEDLSEEEIAKVDKLYETAVQRGIIQEEKDEDEEEEKSDECDIIGSCPKKSPSDIKTPIAIPEPKPRVKLASFTVLYSAMKNGEIKTGETYSNAIDTRSAKADILNKLSRAGYDHIEILAIEAGDPDAAYDDLYNTDFGYPDDEEISDYGTDMLPNAFEDEEEETTDGEEESSEDTEEESSEEDSEEDTEEESSEDSEETSDDEETEDTEEDSEEDSETSDDEDSEEDSEDEETDDEDSEEDEELSKEEKTKYKDQYTKAFKAAMKECKFGKAFDDLTIEEKIKFFEKLQKDWDDSKPDPVKFMDTKEIEALNKEIIKKN